MNKAAISSLLAVAALIPFTFRAAAFGQAPAAGQIVMEPQEQNDYSAAMDKLEGQPAAQAPALEAYLAKYPKSTVKNYVLLKIMFDYGQANNPAKAMAAADNVLAVDPNNLQAYFLNVFGRKTEAETPTTDPATKKADLDAAAGYAKRGLDALPNMKNPGVPDDQWAANKLLATTTFYSTIGEDALNNKDGQGAIAAYKAELAAMPPAQLTTPAAIQEVYAMAGAYLLLTPPDLINCTFYATRAAIYAPDQFKPVVQKTADYCYKHYHGVAKDPAYDAVIAAAKAAPDPAPDFPASITPAPTDADQANALVASTPDSELPKLAVSDREYILKYASDANKAKVWDVFKGKTVEIPGAVVIEETPAPPTGTAPTSMPTVIKVAVSDDAVQNKKADFTFNMKPVEAPAEPKTKTPAATAKYKKDLKDYNDLLASLIAGKTIAISGTWSSYTADGIVMDDGEVVPPKPVAPTKPAPRPAPHKPHN